MKKIERITIVTGYKKETKKVLENLESMGFVWVTGEKPTERSTLSRVKIYVHDDKTLTYSDVGRLFHVTYKEITAAEFLKERKNECIVIYRKGNETIALDKTTGKKAIAKCSPEDEYDLYTGAKLAFDRLTGKEQPKVREVKRRAKVGEYVKIINASTVPYTGGKPEYKDGDILKIIDSNCGIQARYKDGASKDNGMQRVLNQSEYVVLEGYEPPEEPEFKPEFKPYLTSDGYNYGKIGDKTPFKDAIGRELRVGDTVELYNDNNMLISEVVIACFLNKYIVYGIAMSCKKNGDIEDGWKIILKRKYEDIANGEIVDNIKYVKERA